MFCNKLVTGLFYTIPTRFVSYRDPPWNQETCQELEPLAVVNKKQNLDARQPASFPFTRLVLDIFQQFVDLVAGFIGRIQQSLGHVITGQQRVADHVILRSAAA